MLTVPGPLPISPVQRTDENNLFLRVNQKVAGEILQVANDQVVLAIQGVQIVARLSTPDQLMELQDRRFAQFVVKEINPNVVTLQIVEPDSNSKNQVLPVINQQDSQLLDGLLNQIGVKPDAASRLLAQQMIRMGLPVTADNILELQTALQAVPAWGENEAGQAVPLKNNRRTRQCRQHPAPLQGPGRSDSNSGQLDWTVGTAFQSNQPPGSITGSNPISYTHFLPGNHRRRPTSSQFDPKAKDIRFFIWKDHRK